MGDPVMERAVYTVLLDSFLEERAGADVHVLAASRLAVDFLKQGWKELEKLKTKEDAASKPLKQVGL